jgi:Na+:H+ antiporter, NhaA family
VLVICAACALIVANSRGADAYHALWTMPIGFTVGSRQISLTAHEWINDGLMVIFFLLVRLEIKRELLVGELASPNRAAVPIVAAVGGMLVPASIYLLVTGGGPIARDWAIPMATDIALRSARSRSSRRGRQPVSRCSCRRLRSSRTWARIIVSACFYTGRVVWPALGMAGVVVLCLLALNWLRVRRIGAYVVPGLALWWFVHQSGVHATIAGVLLAFTLPMSIVTNAEDFSSMARFSAYVVMPLFA